MPECQWTSIGVCDATPSRIFCDPGPPRRASSPSSSDTADSDAGANKYDPQVSVLLALNPIKVTVYESRIISSGTAGTEYGRLPWLALSASVMRGHTSSSRSLGGLPFDCHWQCTQLIMSYLQTSIMMGDNILQMIVCLRDGKESDKVLVPCH